MNSEALVLERIDNDLKDHTVTVLHNDGMYRHWRCQKPGTWVMGFDVVTWPGSLFFTGDMGEFAFQRTEDMVAFMRGSCMSYSYAAEKCVAHDGRLREWREEIFREALADRIKESEEDDGEFTVVRNGKRVKASVAAKVELVLDEFKEYGDEHSAMKAMYGSGLWDGGDMPDCKQYTFHFLWCLHAINWFCAKVKE